MFTTLELQMVDETTWSTALTAKVVKKQLESGMSPDMLTRSFTEKTKDDSRVRCKLHLGGPCIVLVYTVDCRLLLQTFAACTME